MNNPDKVVLICSSTEPTSTSAAGNSNKFHRWDKLPNGIYTHTYGRVGDPGVSHEVSSSKMQSKMRDALRNGYKEVALVDSQTTTAPAGGDRAVAKTAVQEIAQGDPIITKLVNFLSEQNVHNISTSTTLKYDAASGLFSTPLGIVTQDSIDEARTLLARAQSYRYDGMPTVAHDLSNKLATDYLMLIPTDIGRDRPTFDRVFPDLAAVAAQNDILESLEGSLIMASKHVASKKSAKVYHSPTWDIKLKKMDDDKEIRRIREKFVMTSDYSDRGFIVRNVYDLTINHMEKAFESAKQQLGNVEEMWHGTCVGNILSIFAKGLIIPNVHSNGRRFGNGVYASRQSSKSMGYAGKFTSKIRTSCYMFLVDVAMGKAYTPDSDTRNLPKGYDSMDAVPGKTRSVDMHEAIVYKTSQVSIRRLIEFAA